MPVDGFKWVENTSQFNKDYIKSYNEESDRAYFLKVGVKYSEKIPDIHNYLSFFFEIMKIDKVEKLSANLLDEKYTCHTHKKIKINIKLLISILKSAQSH